MIDCGYHIWLEMWLAGMAGGAYFSAFLAERFGGIANKQLLRLAIFLGIPMVMIALLLSLLDLGEPFRFWHLLVKFMPLSPLSMGVWILQAFVGINVLMAVLFIAENRMAERAPRNLGRMIDALSWTNLVFAVVLITYSGLLLSATNKPLWASTGLLPPIFVASAVATGVAILTFTALTYHGAWEIPGQIVSRLIGALPVVIVIQLALLAVYIILLGASPMSGTGEALKVITTGSLAVLFWIMLAALLVPIGLIVATRGKEIEAKAVRNSLIASSVCVILGNLILRAVIVIGGQI